MSTTPFSYYLYHKPTGKHYYGIRYAKGCNPLDLWVTYFSSSKIVKQLITDYGTDSFVAKVRKTFKTSAEALIWEHKVLRRLNAASKDQWINRHNGGTKFRSPTHHTPETIEKFRSKLIGKTRTSESKERYSQAALKRETERRETGWKPPPGTQEKAVATRKRRIELGEINPYSSERNAKMSASKKGTRRHYLPDGSFIMVKPQADQ